MKQIFFKHISISQKSKYCKVWILCLKNSSFVQAFSVIIYFLNWAQALANKICSKVLFMLESTQTSTSIQSILVVWCLTTFNRTWKPSACPLSIRVLRFKQDCLCWCITWYAECRSCGQHLSRFVQRCYLCWHRHRQVRVSNWFWSRGV